jgi:hypothetical protein
LYVTEPVDRAMTAKCSRGLGNVWRMGGKPRHVDNKTRRRGSRLSTMAGDKDRVYTIEYECLEVYGCVNNHPFQEKLRNSGVNSGKKNKSQPNITNDQ